MAFCAPGMGIIPVHLVSGIVVCSQSSSSLPSWQSQSLLQRRCWLMHRPALSEHINSHIHEHTSSLFPKGAQIKSLKSWLRKNQHWIWYLVIQERESDHGMEALTCFRASMQVPTFILRLALALKRTQFLIPLAVHTTHSSELRVPLHVLKTHLQIQTAASGRMSTSHDLHRAQNKNPGSVYCNAADNAWFLECSGKVPCFITGNFLDGLFGCPLDCQKISFYITINSVFGCMLWFIERSADVLLKFAMWESLQNLWRTFLFGCITIPPPIHHFTLSTSVQRSRNLPMWLCK